MKYRKLGNTGLEVSVLGFGGSSLGSVFGNIDEQEGIRTVHVAVDNGINLIDTAPYYGETKAERVLGRALREIPRGKYLLATKVGRFGVDNFDFSARRVLESVDESLQRLGVDHIDFIQAHDIEFGDLDQIVNETLPALREMQATGKVRFVGITCLPLKTFRQVMERADVDQVQSYCHCCLNDTALLDILPYFKAKGVVVFNSATLAMRLLSHEGPPAWHPAPAALKAKCAAAARFCQDRGGDLGKLALQFAVANQDIPTHIVGTASPARILQNIREIEKPLDEELLADVLKILQPVHNLSWPSGGGRKVGSL
jgi:L-galactose dehydrogenase